MVNVTRDLVGKGHVTLNMTHHLSGSDEARTTILVLFFISLVPIQPKQQCLFCFSGFQGLSTQINTSQNCKRHT